MRNYSTEAEPTTLVGPWLEPLLPELIAFRRDLHAHPELSFKEFRTTDKLVERLEEAGLKPRRLDGTGLTVDIGDGPIATALRGDIDALPIIEETGLPFASKNHGVTHACGHDVHTATMLGVALVLQRMHEESPLRRHRPDHLPAGRGNHARRRPALHRAGRPRRRAAHPGAAL